MRRLSEASTSPPPPPPQFSLTPPSVFFFFPQATPGLLLSDVTATALMEKVFSRPLGELCCFFLFFIWFQFEVKQGVLASQESFSGANVSLFEFRQDAEDKTDGQSLELLGKFSFYFLSFFLFLFKKRKTKRHKIN